MKTNNITNGICAFLLLWFGFAAMAATIPDLKAFSFTPNLTKVLPSNYSTEYDPAGAYNCKGTIDDGDQLGRLALVTLNYNGQGCFADGRYNNVNYSAEKGVVTDSDNNVQFDAYRVAPASAKASEFLASHTGVYYKFPTKEDYTVYKLEGQFISEVINVSAVAIDTSKFIKITDGTKSLTVSTLSVATTYLFVPTNQSVSVYTDLGNGVEGARISSTDLGDLLVYRYKVNGTLYDTRTGFNHGPSYWANRYGQKRQYFNVTKADGEQGVLWQDVSTLGIYITWFGQDLRSATTVAVANNRAEVLAAATHDNAGSTYYITIQSGDGSNTETARAATLYKVDANGTTLASQIQDTSKTGLNMVGFEGYMADLAYQGNKLGLFLGRKMHASNDGLNHQGGIAVVYNADTLALIRNHGQTSGHSFDNFITTRSSGEFLGFDLGDNYPRGINLHKLTESQIRSRVIYTFKTSHGTTATNPAGLSYAVYPEISGGSTTYYKWSNDNEVYSELGAVMEIGGAFTAIFAGEPDVNGKSINNARVGSSLNDARNVGLIQVRADFENASGSGSQISDDLVLTSGVTENSGFYGFLGGWQDQRNAGVVWLTDYASKDIENASRVRAVPLADGNILVFWEKWNANSYISTYAMKVSPEGAVIDSAIDLGTSVRFDRRGDSWSDGTAAFSIAGNAIESRLELFVLEPGTVCGTADVIITDTTYSTGQTVTCAATNSLKTNGSVIVQSGANVTYTAPRVSLKAGFSANSGAVFNARTQ